LPPYKDLHSSIRNTRHKIHSRFVALRRTATESTAGRDPYRGTVEMTFSMHAPAFERSKSLCDYTGGVMDSLDGSHGVEFTYLPIVYEDDCQIYASESHFRPDQKTWFEIVIRFV